MQTKEKIIDVAINLFSTKGYEAVSVRDIAKDVGIKESSIYNHFINKQDIFDTIILICEERANSLYSSLNVIDTFKGNFDFYKNIDPNLLFNITKTSFQFYVVDEYLNKFRKILTIEQYNNDKIQNLFKSMFIKQPLDFQTLLFKELMKGGYIKEADPYSTALEFYSPIFLLFYLYDYYNDEVELILKNHIINFINKNNT